MAKLTAYSAFDSRTVAKFSTSVSSTVTISQDSKISLSDSATSTFTLTFTGSFKPVNAKGSYGTAKEIDFYSSGTLKYTITGAFPVTKDTDGLITFPAPSSFNSLALFKGNDTYIGSTSNDYFSIYDNKGVNIYSALAGNDFIELASTARSIANGGAGVDLIVSYVAGDKLAGGSEGDFFWLGTTNTVITDFSVADADKIVLPKSLYEEKLMTNWLAGNASDVPVTFTAGDESANYYTIPSSAVAVVEGIKSSRDDGTYFVYDLGTGKLYFDQDGPGKKAPTVLTTFSNKPVLNADEVAGSIQFAQHVDNFETYWLASYFSG